MRTIVAWGTGAAPSGFVACVSSGREGAQARQRKVRHAAGPRERAPLRSPGEAGSVGWSRSEKTR